MCEERGAGWAGWMAAPEATALVPAGPWVDLTHPFSASVPQSSIFPAPQLTAVARMPETAFDVTRLETVVHMDTHLD